MLQNVYALVVEYLIKYGFQVLGGLIILIIGWKLSQWASDFFMRFCQKKKIESTLARFLAGILKFTVLIFAGLMAAEKFGVTISPLIASISAVIFGASFAIQAPLSNYAAGLMIILTRPFVVGNTIAVHGVGGVVQEVKLPCTVLVTEDGERITIPNKEIVGQILYNSAEHKVVEQTIGISYDSDPDKAIRLIEETLSQMPKIAQNPSAHVGIQKFGDSAIEIGMRYWVPTKEYHHVLYAANLAVYKALKEALISIPFPQREVRLLQGEK